MAINVPTGMNVQALMMLARTRAMQTLVNCLNIVKDECDKNVPVDEGTLRESIRIVAPKWITPYLVEGKVLAGGGNVPQAWYTEYGTNAHGPVFAQAMHFNWKGAEIFAKWVQGVTPMHWMRNAVTFAIPRIQAEMGLLAKQFLGTYTVTLTKRGL